MSKLATWDITISMEILKTSTDVKTFLKDYCKKWCFQGEKSESGFLHWQCRVSLIVPWTVSTMKNRSKEGKIVGRWSPTSEGTHNGNNFCYVMKAESRIEGQGPFSDKDEEVVEFKKTHEIVEFYARGTLLPWMKTMDEFLQPYDPRCLHIIIDFVGHSCKTVWSKTRQYEKKLCRVPIQNSLEGTMGVIIDLPKVRTYLFDMPRAFPKQHLNGFYAGLEVLKDGECYDTRYKYRPYEFDMRPNIIVLTNVLPDFRMLSIDRWKLWEMQPDHTVVSKSPAEYKRDEFSPVERAPKKVKLV